MEKLETDHAASDSSRRNRNIESRGFATTAWAGLGHPKRPRWQWVTAAAVLAIGLIAEPASAQDADAKAWIIQGGPYAGVSFLGGAQFEAGGRLGARYGNRVLDLGVSTYQIQFQVPPARQRGYEVLAGATWQPSLVGIGFRSGLGLAPNAFGKLWPVLVFGPHYTLAVPVGPLFELRSEAGLYLYHHQSVILDAARGFIRIGVERCLR